LFLVLLKKNKKFTSFWINKYCFHWNFFK